VDKNGQFSASDFDIVRVFETSDMSARWLAAAAAPCFAAHFRDIQMKGAHLARLYSPSHVTNMDMSISLAGSRRRS
jgi:hypothetical protein